MKEIICNQMVSFSQTSFTSKLAKMMVLVLTVTFAFPLLVFAAAFIGDAIDMLGVVIIAIGAGLGVWGIVNLLEGYGNDNRATRS